MKRMYRAISVLFLAFSCMCCVEKEPVSNEQEQQEGDSEQKGQDEEEKKEGSGLSDYETAKRYYVNTFLFNMTSVYYLWIDESSVQKVVSNWKVTADPEDKVLEMRYKDSSTGNDIDRWTQAVSDYEEFTDYVGGTSKTYGIDVALMYVDSSHETICAIVRYVSADSPAAAAGIKRGDVIMKINGKEMTSSNYVSIVNDELYGGETCKLTLYSGNELTLYSVEMYEDPVYLFKTFDIDGKKVGYLVFNSFTQKACQRLLEAFAYFKTEGVSELILDMRYNGGGYVSTENFLANLLAPVAEVNSGSVYSTTVFNSTLTEVWGQSPVSFAAIQKYTDESGNEVECDVTSVNPGITKLYAIMSQSSASASESLLVDLMPYLDVEIIGEQSYGKYCTGLPYSLEDWYDDMTKYLDQATIKSAKKYGANWGMYVMIGRFADKNGDTPCMPDGFEPDVAVSDNPVQPYQLGDENEAMLHAALVRAGKNDFETKSVDVRSSAAGVQLVKVPQQIHRLPDFGMRIDDVLPIDLGLSPVIR